MNRSSVQGSTERRRHPIHAPTVDGVIDEAYGMIPVRRITSQHSADQQRPTLANTEILLVKQRSRRKDAPNGYVEFWSFPKGHAEPGETPFASAQREVFEEVGLQIAAHDLILEEQLFERYPLATAALGVKLVTYWAALVAPEQKVKIQEDEVLDFAWLSWSTALERARPSTVQMLRHAMELLQKEATSS